jgi:uncharacterized protein YjbI with pentapeptide repeats
MNDDSSAEDKEPPELPAVREPAAPSKPDQAIKPWPTALSIIATATIGLGNAFFFIHNPLGWFPLDFETEGLTSDGPWLLVSALATAPSLMLTWGWRTLYQQREQAHTQARLEFDQQQADRAEKQAAREQGRADQRLHSERFTKASEMLSSDKEAIQLAAIYSLERIAVVSKEYRKTIHDLLVAFVRSNTATLEDGAAPPETTPAEVIQAALDVLTKNEPFKSQMWAVRFPGKSLYRADLAGAILTEAILTGATLTEANLSGSTLAEANLSEAKLSGARLYAANLSRATLTKAKLNRAKLNEADLAGASLYAANLSGAFLYKANFSESLLYAADLSGSTLAEANLSGATLSGAKLTEANLTGANLTGADLREADLSGADLTQAICSGVRIDKNTIWPTKFAHLKPAPTEE